PFPAAPNVYFPMRPYVATAGWTAPVVPGETALGAGTHLERYARLLPAVEINTSFYRIHRPGTYERWARSVPAEFRFAVKLSREITHRSRLAVSDRQLAEFLEGPRALGRKLGPLLVQLPPSFVFDAALVGRFFGQLRRLHDGPIACEPRHPSWFTSLGDRVLVDARVARVGADPAVVPEAAIPGGWPGLAYVRLHGSPVTYASPYSDDQLDRTGRLIRASEVPKEAWCVFDNTQFGAAYENARELWRRIAPATSSPA
ncbi:MAG: DUF72 domain-containing protein, partial [Gemmatimonadota bacterium]